jgi:biopolymer transport protein ExbD
VDVRLPVAGNTQERQDKPKQIVVAIKKDSTTYLGTKPLSNQAELTKMVREQLEEVPEDQKMVYLKADSELPYSEVMKVMDLLREGGVEEIALIAESKVQGAS